MRIRDLLTFNLFLQLTDGVVSYQAFALGAIEANPMVAAAILNWGMVWGLIYNKALAFQRWPEKQYPNGCVAQLLGRK